MPTGHPVCARHDVAPVTLEGDRRDVVWGVAAGRQRTAVAGATYSVSPATSLG